MVPILYEDNHILVAVKPIGVLSQADGSDTPDMLTILKQYLKETYHKPFNVYLGLVHRLDKDVGGVMVFAKTSKAASRLSEQVRQHQMQKIYYAVVEGKMSGSGVLENHLVRETYRSRVCDGPSSKLARLYYQVLKSTSSSSLVKIKLDTGRHHQIRVQFAFISHPLLGDKKYGHGGKYPLALYAVSLGFYHPTKKEWLTFVHFPDREGYWRNFTMFDENDLQF